MADPALASLVIEHNVFIFHAIISALLKTKQSNHISNLVLSILKQWDFNKTSLSKSNYLPESAALAASPFETALGVTMFSILSSFIY